VIVEEDLNHGLLQFNSTTLDSCINEKQTLFNLFSCLLILIENSKYSEKIKNTEFLLFIFNFMKNKFFYRRANLINLTILENFDEKILISNKDEMINSINAVCVNVDDENYIEDENTEKEIKIKSGKLLSKVISEEDFKKMIENFKTNTDKFLSDINKNDFKDVESNLIYFISILNIKKFYEIGAKEITLILKNLIEKNISHIESFKRFKQNETNPNYKNIIEAKNYKQAAFNNKTHCGLCRDMNSSNPYKLINTTECISNVITGAEIYNSNLYLLICKKGYILSNNICIPHCYSSCETCSDYSENEDEHKCLTCKDIHYFSINANMSPFFISLPCSAATSTSLPLQLV